MVLEHISQHSCPLVISGTLFHPQRLGHGYLHMVDIALIPQRLEYRVRKTEHQDVLYGFLGKVVVHPVDLFFPKRFSHDLVEFLSALKVMAEGLFDDHMGIALFLL